MKKTLIVTAAASAALPAAAQVSFSINQTIGPSSELYIDLESGLFGSTPGSVPGFDMRVYFEAYEAETPAIQMAGTWDLAYQAPGYAVRYTFGASLSFNNLSSLGYLEYYGGGPWQGGTAGGVNYIAISSAGTGRNGWLGLNYNDAGNSITVESFATASNSIPLTAGASAIPEPAEVGAVVALLAGSAAVYQRRRKVGQAAA